MGTPDYAIPVLEALLSLEARVVAVYTQPDRPSGRGRIYRPAPVKEFALERGIRVVQPPSLRNTEVQGELAALEPDVVVVAAYGRILPPEVLNIPRHGCVNVHPSLLPRYRGPSPVATAILDGETCTGTTLMLIDEGMDTGSILASRSVPIRSGTDTTESLTPLLFEVGGEIVKEQLPLWLDGRVTPLPQDHGNASVTSKLEKKDGEVPWALSAEELERRLRAYTPWPGLFTHWRGRLLNILAAAPLAHEPLAGGIEKKPGAAPNVVVMTGEEGLVVPLKEPGMPVGVLTGRGVLGLKALQMEGGKPVSVQEFLRGHREFVGSRLPS